MTCIKCGKTFTAVRDNALYCSRDCSYRAYLERKRQRYKDTHTPAPTTKKCVTCGGEYTTTNPKQKYCGGKCRKRKWWRQNLSLAAVRHKRIKELCEDISFMLFMTHKHLEHYGRDFVLGSLIKNFSANYSDLGLETVQEVCTILMDKYIKKNYQR